MSCDWPDRSHHPPSGEVVGLAVAVGAEEPEVLQPVVAPVAVHVVERQRQRAARHPLIPQSSQLPSLRPALSIRFLTFTRWRAGPTASSSSSGMARARARTAPRLTAS